MDLRSNGLPIHSDSSEHSRVSAKGAKTACECGREHSSSLSSSDDSGTDEMWIRSKKQTPKELNRNPDKPRPQSKPRMIELRNQNPGIDAALRNMQYEANASLRMYQAFVQCFEDEVEPLRVWAEDHTLDTIWRNKVKDRLREKRDRERFEGVAAKFLSSKVAVKEAVKAAKTLADSWDDKHMLERQVRTAKKALLHCRGLIDLAERAASERLACKELVIELGEVMSLLDRKKQPWMYGDGSLEEQSGRGSIKSSVEGFKREEIGANSERLGDAIDGSKKDRQEDPRYSFENTPEYDQTDADGNQGSETW